MNGGAARDSPGKRHAARAILFAGLLAGALDITAAFAMYVPRGASAIRILQSIAAGLIGPSAIKGGAITAALGLALHFFIALSAAAVYYAASRRLRVLWQRPVPCGLAYGAVVFVVMNFVVVPNSAGAHRPFVWNGMAVLLLAVHLVCVGLPIALVERRYGPTP
jgi:hypothetical protein